MAVVVELSRSAVRNVPIRGAHRRNWPYGVFVDVNVVNNTPAFEAMLKQLARNGLFDIHMTNFSYWFHQANQKIGLGFNYGILDLIARDGRFRGRAIAAPWGRMTSAGGDDLPTTWYNSSSVTRDKATAKALLQPLVDADLFSHPAIGAFSWTDDATELVTTNATTNGRNAAIMADAARELDPYSRPHFAVYTGTLAFMGDSDGDPAGQFYRDAWSTYRYPCSVNESVGSFYSGGFSAEGDWVQAAINRMAGVPDSVATYWILQAHQTTSGGISQLRYPDPSEMLRQVWLAVGEGAAGVYWFAWTDQAGIWDGLGHANSAARLRAARNMAYRLSPNIRARLVRTRKLSPSLFTATGGGADYGNGHTYASAYCSTLVGPGNTYYVVVCNQSASPATVTISSIALPRGYLVCLEPTRPALSTMAGGAVRVGGSVALPANDGSIYQYVPES